MNVQDSIFTLLPNVLSFHQNDALWLGFMKEKKDKTY